VALRLALRGPGYRKRKRKQNPQRETFSFPWHHSLGDHICGNCELRTRHIRVQARAVGRTGDNPCGIQTHGWRRTERSRVRRAADNDTYIDTNIPLFIRGKLTKADGTNLGATDFTAGTNNLLHRLFSQCSIALNGTTITPATDLYNYRSYFETVLSYGSDAASSHLTNAFWYLDDGDLLPCDPTSANSKNAGFIARWNRMKQSKEIQMYGRLHSDICNVAILDSRRPTVRQIDQG
jgi:hypothetical protein